MVVHTNKLRPYFLLGSIFCIVVLLFFVLTPFLIPLLLAAMLAVVLKPVYRYVLRTMSGWPSTAALLTIIFALICVIVPLTFLGVTVASQAQHLAVSLSDGSGSNFLQTAFSSVEDVFSRYVPGARQFSTTLATSIDSYTKEILSWIVSNLGGLFSGVSQFLVSLLIFLISLFYLLRDGTQLRGILIHLSPLADKDDSKVFNRLELAVNSIIRGNFTIVLVQAVLAGIGLALFGVPNPVLWGMVAGLAGLIPTLGSSLVLLPAAGFLLITGSIGATIGLLIWAVVVVGLVDNLLAPKLIGKGALLHPLVVLLTVLGGLAFFGPAGLFLGPLSASLLFALLALYSESIPS